METRAFLGNADIQNSCVLFDGESVVLSRSVRRIKTTWRSHLAYYMHCRCYTWQCKSGFGTRILPTSKKPTALAASNAIPVGKLEDSEFCDADAEAVMQYAAQEKAEEEENLRMGRNETLSRQKETQKVEKSEVVGSSAQPSWKLFHRHRLSKKRQSREVLVVPRQFAQMVLQERKDQRG